MDCNHWNCKKTEIIKSSTPKSRGIQIICKFSSWIARKMKRKRKKDKCNPIYVCCMFGNITHNDKAKIEIIRQIHDSMDQSQCNLIDNCFHSVFCFYVYVFYVYIFIFWCAIGTKAMREGFGLFFSSFKSCSLAV